jgi:hypothetical protein
MPVTVKGLDTIGIFLKQLNVNLNELSTDVQNWMESDILPIAVEKTHRVTGRLKASWKVQRRATYNLVLTNTMFYAPYEFSRRGVKTRGTQVDIGTPHDPRPELIDLISANIQAVVMQSIGKGIRGAKR